MDPPLLPQRIANEALPVSVSNSALLDPPHRRAVDRLSAE
jgi:hypothetical protein